MSNYTKILLATDFSEISAQTVEKAREVALAFKSELCLLHVVEPLPFVDSGYGEGLPFDINLTEQMLKAAQTRLETLAESLNVSKANQWVEIGSPKAEIVRIASEQEIDLIVIGTHGRHGIGLLLGSTAASVIHHASCDVLTVRLKDA